jgi:hypothetical protein
LQGLVERVLSVVASLTSILTLPIFLASRVPISAMYVGRRVRIME